MEAEITRLPGVLLLKPTVHSDTRGLFLESYNEADFNRLTGLSPRFVQDNHAESTRHVLRGLHFQRAPHAQGKLVRVVSGSVYDVVVDLRVGSPTFGQWLGLELSANNRHMLWIPPGLAHGYLTLSTTSIFLYKTTSHYAPTAERCLRWDDPTLAITWPLSAPPVLSPKDAKGLNLAELDALDLQI